jgi:hypothetical protein
MEIFFNQKFTKLLKDTGIKRLNSTQPLTALGKIFMRSKENIYYLYPYEISPNDDSNIMFVMATYSLDMCLISTSTVSRKIDSMNQVMAEYPEAAFGVIDFQPITTDTAEWMREIYKTNIFTDDFDSKSDLEIVKKKILECLNSWRNNQAVYERIKSFQKISYLYGRLGEFGEYEEFIKTKVQNTIGLLADDEDIKIAQKLFIIGMAYPHLSEDQLNQIEYLYMSSQYFEMIDDILFDQELLKRQLNKYDVNKRNIFNNEFPIELIDSTINIFMEDSDSDWDMTPIKLYDRSSNRIVIIDEYSSIDFQTQKLIDYGYAIDNNEFINIISKEISLQYSREFVHWLDDKYDMDFLEDVGDSVLNSDTFIELKLFLNSKINDNKVIEENFLALQRKVALIWLRKVNEKKK